MEQETVLKRLTITGIQQETNDVKLFYIRSDGPKIAYQAGQYLTFVLPEGAGEIRRSYSIASSPAWNEPLCIGVKRIENGLFSRRLVDSARVGDQLLTLGAGGRFILPPDLEVYKQVFFFAAGSGIIPIFALLKTVLRVYPGVNVVLIYSNNSVASTIFYAELLALKKVFPAQLTLEFLFSDSPLLIRAHLHAELIEQFLNEFSIGGFEQSLYYLCGPEAYMRLCTFTLRGLQVPAENIKKEIFHTARSVARIEPPDKAPHDVFIVTNARQYRVPVAYPQTILQAAKDQGLILPYSCEAGRCGNCLARCTRGRVWMSYNEVLTEKELASGYVLTCTAHPVHGDVTLEM